ncbi:hypothetical protein BDN72DRAFT_864047 [Pluteus cervinus]|uniref:Uncharacterized protein n=1 Tax=Pluteus cervinus TaxID=181527 RepID=A0ACD3A6B6_9AGAR|nr:hypothetical protein BDN72DRAFT_864047 [Pluteus cervinus]
MIATASRKIGAPRLIQRGLIPLDSIGIRMLLYSRGDGLTVWLQLMGYRFVHNLPTHDFDSDEESEANESEEGDVGPQETQSHVIEVVNYENSASRRIRVVYSRSLTSNVILSSPLTCFMNFISSTGAYSLYPKSSFVRLEALRVHNGDGDTGGFPDGLFENEGGTVVDPLSIVERDNPASEFYMGTDAAGRRFVGDGKCWSSLLTTDGNWLGPPSWSLVYRDENVYTVFSEPPTSFPWLNRELATTWWFLFQRYDLFADGMSYLLISAGHSKMREYNLP